MDSADACGVFSGFIAWWCSHYVRVLFCFLACLSGPFL